MNGLEIGRLLSVVLESELHDDAFEGLFGREQADGPEELLFGFARQGIEFPSEIVVEEGACKGVGGIQGQSQCRGDERRDGGIPHDEGLLGHDVETVARIGIPTFEVEELGGNPGSVRGAAHQDQHVAGPESPVEQRTDPFDDRRPCVERLDRDVARVPLLQTGLLDMCFVGIGEGFPEPVGVGCGDAAVRDRLGEHLFQPEGVDPDDLCDDVVVEGHDLRQTAPVLAQGDNLRIAGPQGF